MIQKDFEVTVFFRGKQYPFAYGSQAYIFHTGILNGFYERYGMEALLQYVGFVHECYLRDDDRTPLGALADYIAEHWPRLKHKSKGESLKEFYQNNI